MLQITTARAQHAAITVGQHRGAIALVLDGVVLCLVPVGTQATLAGESA